MNDFFVIINMVILMYNANLIKEDLKKTMSEKRFQHSLLVAQEAKKLAKKYNYDEQEAYLAGLVHDVAKEFNETQIKQYKDKYAIKNENTKTIHADIGSIVAKERYNFTNEMCQAIKKHTTGASKMTLLDKIILIADKIGRPNLTEEGLKLKKLAYENLDLALLKYLENLKDKLQKNNLDIDKSTLHLINTLKKENKLN